MEKKPYLVDVPVRVNIWIRPECQRKQLEVLRAARPSVLFLISDGGRNDREWEAIRQNRELLEGGIDWDCTLHKLYEDKNNGLYTMSAKAADLIWSKVDRCIFLEDDQIPSVSYFRFCAELLEKYKDDTRITAIAAMNYAGVWERASADYFFCERGSIWGLALWKRSYELRDPSFAYGKDPYTLRLLKERTKDVKYMQGSIFGYAKDELHEGHKAGGEFYNRFHVYAHHQLYIVPKYNMMNNIGCTEDGAHTASYQILPRAIKSLYQMETHELEFPLKHPKYIIPDQDYRRLEDARLGRDRPLVEFFRRIESFCLTLKYYGIRGVLKRARQAKARKGKTET